MPETWGSALRVPGGAFWWLMQDAAEEAVRASRATEMLRWKLWDAEKMESAVECEFCRVAEAFRRLGRAVQLAAEPEPVDLVGRLSLGGGWMPLG